jgi:O-antigen/teichoic acid export membrane protein
MSELPREQGAAEPNGFLLNVNLVFVSTVLSYGIGFLTVIVLARALGPEGRGVTALYQSAVTLGFAFLGLGIGTALVYFVGRREVGPRRALEAGLSVTLAATAVCAVAIVLIGLLFGDDLRADQVPYWWGLVAVPAVIQYRVVEGVLRAQGRFGAMNALELLQPLLLLGSLLAVEALQGLTVSGAITVWSLAIVPPVLLGYVMLGFASWPRRLLLPSELGSIIRFGLQGQLGNLIQLLNYRLDAYLVLLLVNATGVGLYAVGVALSEGLWFIANSVATVLLTNLTASDEAYASRMTPVVCRNTLLVTALAAIGAAAVAPFVIPWFFGAAFEDAVVPFLWLLPGAVALAGAKVLSAYVFSRGRPMINAWIALATLLVTLTADLVLIPLFEVSGAAAGASLAYLVSLVLVARAYSRLAVAPMAEALLPRFADLALYLDALRSVATKLPSRHLGREAP